MSRSVFTALVALASILPCSFLAAAPAPTQEDLPTLFVEARTADVVDKADAPAILRHRVLGVRAGLLETVDAKGREPADQLILNLFEDVVLTARFDATESAYGGGFIAHYGIEGDDHGVATFSVVNDSVSATIRAGDRLFRITPIGDGQHLMTEVDELSMPLCGTEMPDEDGTAKPGTRTQFNHDDHTIDIMVVYTTDARDANGGYDGMTSLINLAVYEMNMGYSQSDVEPRANLVHIEYIPYNEGGTETVYLSQLQNPSDGVMDQVHTLRNEFGADMVALIYESGFYCGVAYQVICDLNPANESGAFCVVDDDCTTGYYSFAHEFGHLQGAQHDRPNTSGCGLTGYCYGYRTTSSTYRTVMAYAPGTRINFWSNPDKFAPNGEVLGVINSEDNARLLGDSATHVAGYRGSAVYTHGVKTTFGSNNEFAGNMFNLEPRTDLNIWAMYVNCGAPSSTPVTFDIWYRSGSYIGHENSAEDWILMASAVGTSAGPDNLTTIYTTNSHVLEAGRQYGMYIDLTSYDYGTNNTLRYTDGYQDYEDNNLKIACGSGKGEGFGGSTFPGRIWNGVIWYRGATGHRSLTTTWAGGNGYAGNMFDVEAQKNITINSFDISVDDSLNEGTVSVDVWVKNGSYVGHELNPYAWTYLVSDFNVEGITGGQTRIQIPGVDLNAGQSKAFYIHLASFDAGHLLNYTNGSTAFSNSDLIVSGGVGKDEEAFTGATFVDRIWNGDVNYSLAPFNNLGFALAGTYGNPVFAGVGAPLLPGEPAQLNLGNARRNALAALIVGYGTLYAPFKGGTLVPTVDALYVFFTNGSGNLNLAFDFPEMIPPGTSAYLQYWIQDPIGPVGYSASNALQMTTP